MKLIICLLLVSISFLFGMFWSHRRIHQKMKPGIQEKNRDLLKYQYFYRLYSSWYLLEKKNINISYFFKSNSLESVAIYGFGVAGKMVIEELKTSGIAIDYVIDINADVLSDKDIIYYKPDEELPDCQVIIVTINEYVAIREMLSKKVSCPIIFLQDIIDTLLNVHEVENSLNSGDV